MIVKRIEDKINGDEDRDDLMMLKSPEQVSSPPVGLSVVAVHVEEHFSGLLPTQQGD